MYKVPDLDNRFGRRMEWAVSTRCSELDRRKIFDVVGRDFRHRLISVFIVPVHVVVGCGGAGMAFGSGCEL